MQRYDTLAQFRLGTSKCMLQREDMLWLALWASSNYDVLSLKIILTGPPNVHVLWYVCYFEFAQNLTQEASFGYQTNDRENPLA